jgi:REP element-mobilizing transposase RayT
MGEERRQQHGTYGLAPTECRDMFVVRAWSPRPVGTPMKYDPQKHHRQSIRLRQYDYAWPGAYFVTLCVREKECVLGEIVDGEMHLSEWGYIVHEFWDAIPVHFPNVSIDDRVTMPNHGHAIINIDHARRGAVAAPTNATLNNGEKGEGTSPLRPTLGQIVAYYKYQTTKRINVLRGMSGVPFWQRNYWEHVVRDEIDLNRIRQYIENNPLRWHEDQLNPIVPPRPTKR